LYTLFTLWDIQKNTEVEEKEEVRGEEIKEEIKKNKLIFF